MWLCYRFVFYNVFIIMIFMIFLFFLIYVFGLYKLMKRLILKYYIYLFNYMYILSIIVNFYVWKLFCLILNINEEFLLYV